MPVNRQNTRNFSFFRADPVFFNTYTWRKQWLTSQLFMKFIRHE